MARARLSDHFRPHLSASLSTTRKPTLCRVRSYCRPGLPRPTINFMDADLATIRQAHRQILREPSLDDLLLCFFKWISKAMKLKSAALAIVNHKGRARVAIAWLPDSAGIDNRPVSLRRLPLPLWRREHFVCHLDHALAQTEQF